MVCKLCIVLDSQFSECKYKYFNFRVQIFFENNAVESEFLCIFCDFAPF